MGAVASACGQDRANKLVLAQDCASNISTCRRSERAPIAAGWARPSTQNSIADVFATEYLA